MFYEQVTALLRSNPTVLRLGFDPQLDIQWYGKGADHHDLLQITRTHQWMIPAIDAEAIGYKGVWVHYESCRPGHWCIHCELFPRLSKDAKARVTGYHDLLDLKKVITEKLRMLGEEDDWPRRFGAHLRRARRDAADPSSLIVWTFDIGLDKDCSPAAFVSAIVPVIEGTVPMIDDFVSPLATRT